MTYFNNYKNQNKIFKNMNYLDPQCIPREFHYRDNEMTTIASNISPIFYGSVPIHTIIIGDNATGKTTAIKKLLQEVKETLPETVPCYINCRKHHTEYSIYGQIYKQVLHKKAPQIGSNTQKIYGAIMTKLEKTRHPLIVVLDDVNYLLGNSYKASPHSQNVIRNLTRSNESYETIVGIYPIITSQEFKYKFDKEVSTLFTPYEVHFKPYTHEQYYNIIRERCNVAFNIEIDENVIKIIVKKIEKTRNIRKAWDILKRFGIILMESDKTQEEAIMEAIRKGR